MGGVVCDDFGRIVLSFSEFLGTGTNIRAELWAIWRGLSFVLIFTSFPFRLKLTLRSLYRFSVFGGVLGILITMLLGFWFY